MKLTTLLMITAILQVSANALAQKVTLDEKNAPLVNVFNDINAQTGYNFAFTTTTLKNAKPVTISVKNEELSDVLTKIFHDQALDFVIENNSVVIKEKEQATNNSHNNDQQGLAPVPVTVSGKITDSIGTPLIGATVMIKGTTKAVITNENGEFNIKAEIGDQLIVSYVGYRPVIIPVKGNLPFQNIALKEASSKLSEVVVSTGYQQLPQERATGAFDYIDNKLLNRSVSPDILSRLDGVTSSLIFNKNQQLGQANYNIRGVSTISSNPNPLIVVDNFPYDGDINNINPNDVESVTVLKDAAAASIWGAFAGNGVIVITTKKGRYNQAPKTSLNTNVTVGNKPNLWYTPQISSSDYIDVEKYLFNQGYFDGTLSSGYQAVSPVVEILNRERSGQISSSAADAQINTLRNVDTRNDLNKYFYQKSVNQQYNVNVSGGGENNQYYFSAGYDKDLSNAVGNQNDRLTLTANNTYSAFNHKLEINTGIVLTQSNSNSVPAPVVNQPYLKLADANGNALAVPNQLRVAYVDTVGSGHLLDWHYRPLDELHDANNTNKLTDYRLNFALKYKIISGLDVNALYQYSKGVSETNDDYNLQSYTARNLINQYSVIDPSTGQVTYNVPLGGILNLSNNTYHSHDFRLQTNYSHGWNGNHTLSAIGGIEIKSLVNQMRGYNIYGYDDDLQTNSNVDFVTQFPIYYGGNSNISSGINNAKSINNYLSYFFNLSYTYRQKYTLSASAREDQSNLFGVKTNQKGTPLGHIGASWEIDKENFYNVGWLPYLKLRVTDGYNGNVNNTISAYTTILGGGINQYNYPYSNITNPPNPSLRWERDQQLNWGVDFGIVGDRVSGSLDYYIKNGKDLIGTTPTAPQVGTLQFTGNVANMKGHGLEIAINSKNIQGPISWITNFLFNYQKDVVTKYFQNQNSISSYLNPGVIYPQVGKPLFTISSFEWAGLDGSGNPQTLLNGKPSENYSAIISSSNFSDLKYNGPSTPPFFGSIRNTIQWKEFSFSFNIIYKLDYYFRRQGLNYSSLFSGGSLYMQDYINRWKQPGDEKNTTVPSLGYPVDPSRDFVYDYSSILVDRADQIRLKDVTLDYTFHKFHISGVSFRSVRFYVYANNMCILWKRNKDGIDPDAVYGYPSPRSISLGLNINF